MSPTKYGLAFDFIDTTTKYYRQEYGVEKANKHKLLYTFCVSYGL